ncbi:MAG: redoxin domain-containing protein [Candidatus Aenigmarchaeota archaeon]|nr:redoxin domain-containing protein [Candidatus Aenigmarchaeota archaeon]
MKALLILAMASVLVVSGCISSTSQATKNQTQNDTLPADLNIGLNIGQIAPDFSLQDPEYGTISKATFQGKPLFIFFTTIWCVPCQVGAQSLVKYDDERGGNAFNVLIVFVDDNEMDRLLLNWKRNFGREDWYVAKGAEMAKTYQVQYLDTKYVLDRQGVTKWIDTKPLGYSIAKAVLEPLLE